MLSGLGHPDRLDIVIWLLANGPARQVEILEMLREVREEEVNPGTVTGLLKPLFESGVIARPRPRAPISVRDPARTAALLQVAAALGGEHADEGKRHSDDVIAKLRRALIAPVAFPGTGGKGNDQR